MSALYVMGGVLIGFASTMLATGHDPGYGFLFVPGFGVILASAIMEYNRG